MYANVNIYFYGNTKEPPRRDYITDGMETIEKEKKNLRPFDDGFIFPLKGVIVVRSYVNAILLGKTNNSQPHVPHAAKLKDLYFFFFIYLLSVSLPFSLTRSLSSCAKVTWLEINRCSDQFFFNK